MLRNSFRAVLYLSLAFFAWYLYHADYIVFKKVSFNHILLAVSLLILFAGFIISTLSWGNALSVHGHPISPRQSIQSHGLSVFAKYIPGKIWVILGRASFVSNNSLSLRLASLISLKEQLIYLFWGLLLSFLPVMFFLDQYPAGIIIFLSALFIAFMLFSPWAHNFLLYIISKLLKRSFELPILNFSDALKISKVVIVYWLVWTIAFYMLLIAVFPNTHFMLAFTFPVSVTYGVLAIVMPGGIGVREGILTAFLIAGGMPVENAITLSVISRFWFIAGEIFLFLFALILKLSGTNAGYPEYPSTSQKAKTENH
jgi:glycosyltransferase 2 family protein